MVTFKAQSLLTRIAMIGTAVSLTSALLVIAVQLNTLAAPTLAGIRFVPIKTEPPDRGTPPTQGGTGSRGSCLPNTQLPALTQITGSDRLSLTVSEQPTIWVYVPYSAQEAPTGQFSLQDGDDDVYRTQVSLPASPGVVAIPLPKTLKALELGKRYRWYLDVDCPKAIASNRRQPATLMGIVQRIAPSADLQRQLQTAKTGLQRAAAYANHGIWYNTIMELAQLRLNEPNNAAVTQAWVELLSDRAIGLESVAKQPIVGAITTSSQPR